MKRFISILTAVISAYMVLSSCSGHDEEMGNQLTLALDVALPVKSVQLSDNSASTRAGDPGIAEFFERPTMLYLFLAVGDPTDPSNNDVYFWPISAPQGQWQRSADSLVFLSHLEQVVNNWDKHVSIDKNLKCRAYMSASFSPVMFKSAKELSVNPENNKLENGFKESDLLNLQFFAFEGSSNYSGFSLRDLYSTPYNLSKDFTRMSNAVADRTNYYGTVTNIQGVGTSGIITIQDTLYHTAAKIDFQWNAESYVQNNVICGAVVNNAPKVGFLFKPTEQTMQGTYSKVLLASSYVVGINDMNNTSNTARYSYADEVTEANKWSGRAYTYVLQPGNLDYKIYTTAHHINPEIKTAVPKSNGTTNAIFAAWYDLNFNIKDVEVGN